MVIVDYLYLSAYVIAACGLTWLLIDKAAHSDRSLASSVRIVALTAILGLTLSSGFWVLVTIPLAALAWLRLEKVVKAGRMKEMGREVPHLIDFLAFNIEAGSSVYHSLLQARKVLDPDRTLIKALDTVKEKVELGILSQADAMDELAGICSGDDINSPFHAVARAIRNGTPLVATLKKQSDQLRAKAVLEGERRANVLAVKLLIPLVIFIFPASFLVILSPVLVSLLGSL